MTEFTGTLVAGATYTADGRFTLNTSSGSDKFTLNIPAFINVQNSGKTLSIGKLTGSGTLGGYCSFSQGGSAVANTWNVGNDENFTFDGKVTSTDIFNKVGSGTMTVTNSWENTGAVNVKAGRLILGLAQTLGKGALTVSEGAVLTGMSSIIRATSKSHPFTNSAITMNGDLRVGSDGKSSAGFWYFGAKPLTFGATGKLFVGVQKCATSATAPGCTHIWGDQSVTFKDGATVSVYFDSTYDPTVSIAADEAKADSFYVFNFPKAVVGDVKFELPELPEHYYWDTNKFKNGYLYIRYSTSVGIKGIAAGETVSAEVFTANGINVANFVTTLAEAKAAFYQLPLPKGVYILRLRSEKNTTASMTLRR